MVDIIGRESTAVLVARASPPFAAPVLAIAEKEDAATLLGADGELAASSLTLHVACKGIERPGTTTAAASRHSISHSSAIWDRSSFSFLALAALLLLDLARVRAAEASWGGPKGSV